MIRGVCGLDVHLSTAIAVGVDFLQDARYSIFNDICQKTLRKTPGNMSGCMHSHGHVGNAHVDSIMYRRREKRKVSDVATFIITL